MIFCLSALHASTCLFASLHRPIKHSLSNSHMAAMASLRLTIPRSGFQLHAKQLQHPWIVPNIRHASTTPPPKPRVLAQPDKFRPPSHPSRLRDKTPRYQYGPDLTQEQKTKKQYPHMMPPEGSFMHWFLTNRTIHLFISLVRKTCVSP